MSIPTRVSEAINIVRYRVRNFFNQFGFCNDLRIRIYTIISNKIGDRNIKYFIFAIYMAIFLIYATIIRPNEISLLKVKPKNSDQMYIANFIMILFVTISAWLVLFLALSYRWLRRSIIRAFNAARREEYLQQMRSGDCIKIAFATYQNNYH